MKRKIPLIIFCILFAGITLYYGLGIYRQWQEYRVGEQAYEELTQYVQPKVPVQLLAHTIDESHPTEPTPTEEIDDTIWPVVDFEALKEINPDIVAWIYIEGTNINYPVVQSEDNSYYLNRLFNGIYSKVGSIFMDYRNSAAGVNRLCHQIRKDRQRLHPSSFVFLVISVAYLEGQIIHRVDPEQIAFLWGCGIFHDVRTSFHKKFLYTIAYVDSIEEINGKNIACARAN